MTWVCMMYHDVTPERPSAGGGPGRFTVSLASFERLLDAIVELDMRGCSMAEALRSGGEGRVAITFDDGSEGQFEHAFPALVERGMTATFFVTTDWVGTPGFVTWEQLRTMRASGMSIQSHTKSHPHLSELDRSGLVAELAGSKAALDRELGQDTTEIALPGGNAPRWRLRGTLGECGYEVVATSRWGTNRADGSSWIRRCTAPRNPTPELAQRIVTGDARLTALRYPREAALNGFRAVVGASRYARWRRRVLDILPHG